MTNLLNTLYVTTQGAYLRKDHENIVVRIDKRIALEVPLHHLASLVCFGQVGVSPLLLSACCDAGIAVSFLSKRGRFLARVEGPRSGNVLLRRAQYRQADAPDAAARLARGFVAGKIANSRGILLRSAREQGDTSSTPLLAAAESLRHALTDVDRAETVEALRGHEGGAAAVYFGVFSGLVRKHQEAFRFEKRSRRPPLDAMNALLSFVYALVLQDCAAALQSVGLDPSVGYLHTDRPGRPSLALDLAEEFRTGFADRLVLAMINLGQVQPDGFVRAETGAVSLKDAARREVLVAYQRRKQEELVHPFTSERATLALVFHIQALLLARAIRGELDAYPPFVLK